MAGQKQTIETDVENESEQGRRQKIEDEEKSIRARQYSLQDVV